MNTKLTLSLDKKVIKAAKRYAKDHHVSLSKLIEEYLMFLIHNSDEEDIPDDLKEITGIVKLNEPVEDYKQLTKRFLDEKHLGK